MHGPPARPWLNPSLLSRQRVYGHESKQIRDIINDDRHLGSIWEAASTKNGPKGLGRRCDRTLAPAVR